MLFPSCFPTLYVKIYEDIVDETFFDVNAFLEYSRAIQFSIFPLLIFAIGDCNPLLMADRECQSHSVLRNYRVSRLFVEDPVRLGMQIANVKHSHCEAKFGFRVWETKFG